MTLLEVRDLTSGYGEVQILWGLSFRLEAGRLTTLIGANGSGKTTTLRAVMGLIRPWRGAIFFDGQDITLLPPHRKAAMGLILVPEGRQLFTDMTVQENLEMGAVTGRARARFRQNLDYVFDLFPRLKERRHQKAGTLSGGEQQMLAIARALMAEPRVLFLDEPSLGLSPLLVLNLFEVIRRLKAQGLTMLLVEQNVHLALAVSDYAYVLSGGRIELEGPARQIARDDRVRQAYLGL
ncbi:MAG: ABC transporter ATP-binding protein [Thermoflexus sp.]|jgi:branched-chain amino acid transport system ATP-binding protein|uniref:ABC transporter ATP-binding protein n=1 Tax=Thermoflexus TaxID=1495649 RepID=UPI001C742E4F|nr:MULTISPECIES: ABC transporter ATP-binding protein [Thermoflexus]MDT7884179.1 ABC transporter ATP-binding protein [Thermoflexus sp.]MDT7947769.1 ABC transporter ATP-binding protein [Thermoflexus sp.]QWK10706.1 MAG: ABC transporter ATP-binding protein [Thermoflexus hugenholtzii]